MQEIELSVAIMAFNEIEGLNPTVVELVHQLETLSLSYEVLIIDDGSRDGTSKLAQGCADKLPRVRLVRHPTNLGLGEVYRTGFREARGKWLTFFPGDGQVPADCLAQFVQSMPECDLLLGYIPQTQRPWISSCLSFLDRSLYRLLFGELPPFQGIFMVRMAELRKYRLLSRGRSWSILKEMIIRITRGGGRWRVIPTGIRERYGGQSKVRNFRSILENFLQALSLRVRMLLEG